MHIALCNHDSSKNFERDRDWTAVVMIRPPTSRKSRHLHYTANLSLNRSRLHACCCCQAIRRKRQREWVCEWTTQHEETSVCPVYALCISIDENDDFEGSMLSCETFFFFWYRALAFTARILPSTYSAVYFTLLHLFHNQPWRIP